MSLPWPGVLDPSLLKDEVVARNHRLADAAKAGRWSEVFELLELEWVSVNQWRARRLVVVHPAAPSGLARRL